MKKLLVFSVSLLCITISLVIAMHGFGEIAIARTRVPAATEVVTAAGDVFLAAGGATTVPWPLYEDGTPATVSECQGIVSQREIHAATLYAVEHLSGGLSVINDGQFGFFLYLIVCSRSASGPLAVEETTWGKLKSLYADQALW